MAIDQNELYHYGVKGQKWGVRRYQNKDGSLTPEGEARYYNPDGSLTKAGRYARDTRQLSFNVQWEHAEKLHDSKPKKNDEPGIKYFDHNVTKGKEYVKNLSKQILEGRVTSFTERADGTRAVGKTAKGVVVRDKDGNRVTLGDYHKAQDRVRKMLGFRIPTGQWS